MPLNEITIVWQFFDHINDDKSYLLKQRFSAYTALRHKKIKVNIEKLAIPSKWWVAPNFSISFARVEFNSMQSISQYPLSLKSEMPKIPRRPPPCGKNETRFNSHLIISLMDDGRNLVIFFWSLDDFQIKNNLLYNFLFSRWLNFKTRKLL